MHTVAFANLKGGVGKSALLVLVARYLSATGNRVLVLDTDVQRSATFYFAQDTDDTASKTLANAIVSRSAKDNIIDSGPIHYLGSSLMLPDLRSIALSTLRELLKPVAERYDFALIDTSPSLDNFVLSAIAAAQTVVVPVEYGQWPIHATASFLEKVERELQDLSDFASKKFLCVVNKVQVTSNEGPDSMNAQYRKLLASAVAPDIITPIELRQSATVKRALDTLEPISLAQDKAPVFNAVADLCRLIVGRPLTNGDSSLTRF